jgi:cyclic pyranopterin phosphate synthase
MVDVSAKRPTRRLARAEAKVWVGSKLAALLAETGGVGKGPVLETARLAGLQAAKRTWELIPLCHPLPLEHIEITAAIQEDTIHIEAVVKATARTGVEMEALTAAAVAALTVYDMVKAASKEVEILHIRLLEKRGGKSGTWRRGGTKPCAG